MSSGYAQWSPSTTYVVNDVVEFAGLVYQSTQINQNVSPYPATPVWALIGGGGGGFVQTISLAGNTITLAPSGGTVDIAAATSVASVVAKTTAQTYDTGFAFTEFNSLVKMPELQVSDPTSPNTVAIDGGNAQIQMGNTVGTAPPTIDFYTQATGNANLNFYNAIGAADSSIQYSGANSKITVNSDLITLDSAGAGLIEMNGAGVAISATPLTLPILPNAAATSVVGFDAITKQLSYFATPGGGGGSIVGVAAGANIAVDNTNPAVPIVSLSAPLTSTLDVGTQDITTSIANADIDITTNGTGRVHITQAGVSANGAMTITQTGAGGGTNPALRLVNQNATGSVATEIYKNKPTAGAPSDVLHTQSVFGKDSTNAKQEYTRITHTIREATAGTEDGSIEMGCFTNGTFQNYIQINGNDPANGEVNILRPLDLGTGSTGLIKTSVAGGNINITADTTGYVALNSASGQVQLNAGNSVVAKGVNGVLLQTGTGTDRLKVLPTAVELAGCPFDAKGERVKSTSGSFLLGDGSISVDTRITGQGVNLISGDNDVAYRFLSCFGVGGDVYIYRRTNFTDTTGAGQPAVFEVVNSPFRSLQISQLPVAFASGISDGSTLGSAGQVITSTSTGWSWQNIPSPSTPPLSAVLTAGNSAGSSQINMDGNAIITSAGDLIIDASPSAGVGNISAIIKSGGNLILSNLPVSNPGISGAVWNNGGVLNIA